MVEFSEITISDKALFDKYLMPYNPQASELSFTNLFMWRNSYKFRYAEVEGFLCIVSVQEDKEPFALMPVGDVRTYSFERVVYFLKEYFTSKGWKLQFKRVTEDELQYFRSFVDSDSDMVFDRDSSDYVYLAQDLINLSGKKYDGKRNHINKFKKMYEFEYMPLSEEYVDECSRIMEEWCAERDCDDHKDFYCEKLANNDLLQNYRTLGCKGALIRVNGRFEAFTIGEMLNSDTAVIHIEKASSKINGVYTFINQQFCENEWMDAEFVNREQDLGIVGLRKAKLSYNPAKLIKKYSLKIA